MSWQGQRILPSTAISLPRSTAIKTAAFWPLPMRIVCAWKCSGGFWSQTAYIGKRYALAAFIRHHKCIAVPFLHKFLPFFEGILYGIKSARNIFI